MKPQLNVVKPARKNALCENVSVFTDCFESNDIFSSKLNNIRLERVTNGVFYIDDVLSIEECNNLYQSVKNHQSLSFWSSQGRNNEEVRMFRDADTVEVINQNIADVIWSRVENLLCEELSLTVEDDAADSNWERELVGSWRPLTLNHDFLFALYPLMGAFAPHTDGRAVHSFNCRSFYSVIVFLNTIPIEQGGGTRFYKSEALQHLEKISLNGVCEYWTCSNKSYVTAEVGAVAGRMLVFHQSLVHEGIPSVKEGHHNEKCIIRSDIMSTRFPAICDSLSDVEAYRIFKLAEDLAEQGNVVDSVPLFRRAFKLSPEMARIMGQG